MMLCLYANIIFKLISNSNVYTGSNSYSEGILILIIYECSDNRYMGAGEHVWAYPSFASYLVHYLHCLSRFILVLGSVLSCACTPVTFPYSCCAGLSSLIPSPFFTSWYYYRLKWIRELIQVFRISLSWLFTMIERRWLISACSFAGLKHSLFSFLWSKIGYL